MSMLNSGLIVMQTNVSHTNGVIADGSIPLRKMGEGRELESNVLHSEWAARDRVTQYSRTFS